MPIYGDGKQIRDWLYVIDHCEAIHQILTRGKIGETYNIGGGNQTFNLTIVETLCDLLDKLQPANSPHRQMVQFVEERPGHDRRYAMDISKINRELGWSPRTDLAEGLRLTVEWYFANPEWVATITSQQSYRQWMEKNYSKRVIQL
jgi:dTDP-glucose 4,6-dehydratase